MMDKYKLLFDTVKSIGETMEGAFHIIDNTEYGHYEEEKTFRVYHKEGYCFDVSVIVDEDEQTGEYLYSYTFYAEWEGFDKINVDKAIELLLFK